MALGKRYGANDHCQRRRTPEEQRCIRPKRQACQSKPHADKRAHEAASNSDPMLRSSDRAEIPAFFALT
jgi:hypothetical protein